jgi:2-amino-4-hydroxy-6-hydroxymethyldihydropteridine diphosphokinase
MGIYLGLGSNVGDREAQMRQVLRSLQQRDIRPLRTASLYSTEPRDFEEQPWFLTTVVEVHTALDPSALLHHCLAIEEEAGRVRAIPKGPRVIDIDILLYNDLELAVSGLKVPHPRFRERRFVLVPLVELAPGQVDPVSGLTMLQLLEACPDTGTVQRVGNPLL